MDRRTAYQTRRLVDLTVAMLEIGVFTTVRQAAEHLRTFNVPLHVAVKTLARRPS